MMNGKYRSSMIAEEIVRFILLNLNFFVNFAVAIQSIMHISTFIF